MFHMKRISILRCLLLCVKQWNDSLLLSRHREEESPQILDTFDCLPTRAAVTLTRGLRPPPIRIIVIKPHRLILLLYPSLRFIWRHNIGVLDQKSLGIGSLSVYSSNLQGGALIT